MELMKENFLSAINEKPLDPSSNQLSSEKYNEIVSRLMDIEKITKKTAADYRMLKSFKLVWLNFDGKRTPMLYKCETNLRFVSTHEIFDIIHSIHLESGHASRDIMHKKAKCQYANITKEHINIYRSLCESCQLKKNKVQKSLVVRPILSKSWNSRCQVDLIDMQSQSDGEYRFILNYQDHLTKYVILRPLKTKTADEVSSHLVDIFCMRGAPTVLQSDNGREFSNKVVKAVLKEWPECRLVHGKPRHSQSQGSVERANRDVENILTCWLRDNEASNWSKGLRFVQWKNNNRFHEGIGRSPHEAEFEAKGRLGLNDLNLPKAITETLETEEQLEKLSIEEKLEVEIEDCEQASSIYSNELEIVDLRVNDIDDQRSEAQINQERQAHKMTERSASSLTEAAVGTTVMVPVPEVDRSKADFPNVKAVVVEKKDNGLYLLGTSGGLLKQQYARSEFMPCMNDFITLNEVPMGNEVSLREMARSQSMGHGQGFFKCNCKHTCLSPRCGCKRNGVKCNSKCHNSSPCDNKFD